MDRSQSDEEILRLIDGAISFYTRHYNVKFWQVGRGRRKIILGSSTEARCRFCRRSAPDASFNNIAHAIPEALGNSNLFTYYECDDCNQSFGNSIENDFGNWFLPRKIFSGLKGKKGDPSIKSRDKKSRLDWKEAGLYVDHPEGSDFFVADEENNTLRFNMDVPSYIPINVWKSFIKMGISLADEDKVRYFSDSVAWITGSLRPDEFVRAWPIQSYTMPGPGTSPYVIAAMLYRKSDYLKLPYSMLYINYGIQSLQIHIPSSAKDFTVEGVDVEMPILPLFNVEEIKKYGVPQLKEMDLSGNQLIKDEKFIVYGTYGDRTKI